jgi:hypothetical protein
MVNKKFGNDVEVAMISFQTLSQNSPDGTDKDYEKIRIVFIPQQDSNLVPSEY